MTIVLIVAALLLRMGQGSWVSVKAVAQAVP